MQDERLVKIPNCFYLFLFLSEKLVPYPLCRENLHRHKQKTENLILQAAEICYVTDPIMGELAENLVSSFICGVFHYVSKARKDLVSLVK